MPEDVSPVCFALVVEPDLRRKGIINCVSCKQFDYYHWEYKILKDEIKNGPKLVFFKVVTDKKVTISPVCHFCLEKIALSSHPAATKVKLVISSKDGDKELEINAPNTKI